MCLLDVSPCCWARGGGGLGLGVVWLRWCAVSTVCVVVVQLVMCDGLLGLAASGGTAVSALAASAVPLALERVSPCRAVGNNLYLTLKVKER